MCMKIQMSLSLSPLGFTRIIINIYTHNLKLSHIININFWIIDLMLFLYCLGIGIVFQDYMLKVLVYCITYQNGNFMSNTNYHNLNWDIMRCYLFYRIHFFCITMCGLNYDFVVISMLFKSIYLLCYRRVINSWINELFLCFSV